MTLSKLILVARLVAGLRLLKGTYKKKTLNPLSTMIHVVNLLGMYGKV